MKSIFKLNHTWQSRSVFQLLILVISLMDAPTLFAQNPWRKLSPITWNKAFNVYKVSKEGTVIALGKNNQNIQYQPSSGWSNISINTLTSAIPAHLEFVTDSIVIAVYQDFSLWKSLDKGLTWFSIGNQSGLSDFQFFSKETGYGKRKVVGGYQLVKTTDGGLTWQQTTALNLPQSYNGFDLAGSTRIWCRLGKNLVYSQDEGLNWDTVSVGSNKTLLNFEMVDSLFGYAYSNSAIYYTNDGGSSWIPENISATITEAKFLSQGLGWYMTNTPFTLNRIGFTGTGWQNIMTNSFGLISNLQFVNQNEGWAFSSNGLVHSLNGGLNWKNETKITGHNLNSAIRQLNSTYWIVGDFGEVLKSENSGASWSKVQIDPNETFKYINFFNPLDGVIISDNKNYHTSNGGVTWISFVNPGLGEVTQVQYISSSRGFLVRNNILYSISNLSNIWNIANTPPSVFFNKINTICFTDSLNGFVQMILETVSGPGPPPFNPGGFPELFKTTNGGVSWSKIGESGGLYYHATPQIGFIFTDPDSSKRTLDGGQTFLPVYLGNRQTGFLGSIISCQFFDDSIGYVLSSKGSIFRTSNFGLTWQKFAQIDTTYYLKKLVFRGTVPVFAIGDYGKIFGDSVWIGLKANWATGRVVRKQNNDCTIDSDEQGIANRLVVAEPGNFYGSTDQSGDYSIDLDTGNYHLKQITRVSVLQNLEAQYCPNQNESISVGVTGLADTIPNNNFINEVKDCAILSINLYQEILRHCVKSSLQLQVQNLGNIPSDSEYLFVKFPPQLHYKSATSLPVFIETDSTYRFSIPSLQPFQQYFIHVVDSMSCTPTIQIGQTLCINATIPNAPAFLLQSPGWDGANLEVASRCQNGQTKFTLHNKGAAMASTSQYQIFIDSALVYLAPFQLVANGSMTVSLPVNAPSGFVRLVVPQSANHPLSTFASAEANCATGQSTNGIFPPPDESPLVDIECAIVRNSYDPNDKQVFPTGWGADGNIEPGTEFKYTVRFQNTGTDTAFKVVLIDTLDEDLDIASLQIGDASHPNQFTVSGKGRPVLRWTFNNILLPDSNTNEEKSHGFVSYSVRPKAGLSLGTKLENFADIYFDYNDPVRTNTTVNTIWEPTYTQGILDTVFVTAAKKPLMESSLSIFPNPTKGKLEVHSAQSGVITIFSSKGEIVLITRIEEGLNTLNLSRLPKGLYMAQLQNPDGLLSKKIVLE